MNAPFYPNGFVPRKTGDRVEAGDKIWDSTTWRWVTLAPIWVGWLVYEDEAIARKAA